MNKEQYNQILKSLADVREAVMTKELTDVGWDLRDEVLALEAAITQLATVLSEASGCCP